MIRALMLDLQDLLKKEGADFAEDLRRQVPRASGSLYDSVEGDLKTRGDVLSIEISANESLGYIERGRKPNGVPPPTGAIAAWLQDIGKDPKLAFVVARSIGKKGIPPRPHVKRTIERNEAVIGQRIEALLGEHVKIEGANLIKRLFQVG